MMSDGGQTKAVKGGGVSVSRAPTGSLALSMVERGVLRPKQSVVTVRVLGPVTARTSQIEWWSASRIEPPGRSRSATMAARW
ncbi:hypothetical protein GCM10029976_061140 [Kribbella albertanoniae]